MITLKAPWDFGTIVYLRVQPERVRGMVTGYFFTGNGTVLCQVGWPDTSESRHYTFELTTEFVPNYEEN